jgi:trk system potassium uptake protein TrkA
MNIIIIGCGKLGVDLIARLLKDGHRVTVIANAPDLEEMGRDYQLQVVVGNPVDDELLIRAGIKMAQAVLCVTSDQHLNLMLAQIAKNVHHVPYTLAEIIDPNLEQLCCKNGIGTVCPLRIEATHIVELLSKEA